MRMIRWLWLVLMFAAVVVVHGNGKTSHFLRIIGLSGQANDLVVTYTNTPGITEVWLGTTNRLSESHNAWQVIATNTQSALQTSNFFQVPLPPASQPLFLRLLAPKSP